MTSTNGTGPIPMATASWMRLGCWLPLCLLAVLHSSCMTIPATHRCAAVSGRVVAPDGKTPVGGVLLVYDCTLFTNIADASTERTVRLCYAFSSTDGSFFFPEQLARYSRPIGLFTSSEFGWFLSASSMDSEGASIGGRPEDDRNALVVRLWGLVHNDPHRPCYSVASSLDRLIRFGAVSPSDPQYPELKRLERRVIDYARSHLEAGIDYTTEKL